MRHTSAKDLTFSAHPKLLSSESSSSLSIYLTPLSSLATSQTESIACRVKYKIACLTFKAIYRQTLHCLNCILVSRCQPSQNLRSQDKNLLTVTASPTCTILAQSLIPGHLAYPFLFCHPKPYHILVEICS